MGLNLTDNGSGEDGGKVVAEVLKSQHYCLTSLDLTNNELRS